MKLRITSTEYSVTPKVDVAFDVLLTLDCVISKLTSPSVADIDVYWYKKITFDIGAEFAKV
jgi:hypothetical protein